MKNDSNRRKQDVDKGVFESVEYYSEKSGNKSGDNSFIANKGTNGRACDVHTEQPASDRARNIGKSEVNSRPKKTKLKTTLYVVVDQEKIKTEVLKAAELNISTPTTSRSVKYSILQIIPFVNNKDVLRCLPSNMLWRQGSVPCLP